MFYRCRSRRSARVNAIFSATLFPLMFSIILLYGGYAVGEAIVNAFCWPVYQTVKQLILGISFVVLGAWGVKTSLQISRFERRLYALSHEGISLSGNRSNTHFIPWDNVKEVSIYAYQATPAFWAQASHSCSQDYSIVYCVLLDSRPSGFEYKLLRSDFYAAKHYNSFVVIDCTEESKSLFDTYCPYIILDRRSTQIEIAGSLYFMRK